MTRITVRFRGPIAGRITGGGVEVELQKSTTIGELLNQVMKQVPYLQTIWNSPTEIDRDSMILCNEVDIGIGGGLSSIVNDGDVLTILPLVHGG
ncbi:MAG: MoaD/ThiS family protein [Candidatus Thorarchaeota archaeon]|nr:MoaD/ThiS family protein [Candidatus Thorarchaeota archaeon]